MCHISTAAERQHALKSTRVLKTVVLFCNIHQVLTFSANVANQMYSPDMRPLQGFNGTLPRHARLPKDAPTPTDRQYPDMIRPHHINDKEVEMTIPMKWPSVRKAGCAEPEKALQAFENPSIALCFRTVLYAAGWSPPFKCRTLVERTDVRLVARTAAMICRPLSFNDSA